MKSMNKVVFAVAILFAVLSSNALSSQKEEETFLTHLVICWLDKSVQESEINMVVNEAKKLVSIPGVSDFSVGKAIESERAIVDDSFTFAISMKFRNLETMNQYLTHKIHTDFVEKILKPRIDKIKVYDF